MRMEPLRVALAQMNATVGDIEGNTHKIRDLIGEAREDGARLVLFPELAITGYPPDGDPIYKNAVYGDNFVVMMLLDGTLKPKEG